MNHHRKHASKKSNVEFAKSQTKISDIGNAKRINSDAVEESDRLMVLQFKLSSQSNHERPVRFFFAVRKA
jgi:hypothetical protein